MNAHSVAALWAFSLPYLNKFPSPVRILPLWCGLAWPKAWSKKLSVLRHSLGILNYTTIFVKLFRTAADRMRWEMGRARSTNFPVIDLQQALELTTKIWEHAERHPVPVTTVMDLWGYSHTSSSAKQRLAAIRAFGLIETLGSGEKRKIKLTDEAAKVLAAHPEKQRLLKELSLEPRIHRRIWDELCQEGLPPDDTIRHYLMFEFVPPFKEQAASRLIAEFKRTISFVGLDQGLPEEGEQGSDTEPAGFAGEGEEGNEDQADLGPAPRYPGSDRRRDVFSVEEGEIVIEWPNNLSTESVEDVQGWLEIITRKMRRAAGEDVTYSAARNDPDEGEA